MVAVVAHIPWILWAIDVALREEDFGKAMFGQAAVAILVAARQALLGFPQMIWFTLILEVLYVALLSPRIPSAAAACCLWRWHRGSAR